jgi:uncharacterized protein YjiS (DUF1127 family)
MTVAIALPFMRIIKLLARLKRAIETELAVRHAISELSQMSDYMLWDLGITRGEIEYVVRRPCALTGSDEGLGRKTASIVPGIVVGARRSDAPVRSLPPQAAA